MPMINVAVSEKGALYKSATFEDCLTDLGWPRGVGWLSAISLFGGMCNNNIFCPTLSKEKSGKLKMVWQNETHGLFVWVHPTLDEITFATVLRGKSEKTKTIKFKEVETLLEYWATFVAQGEPKPSKPCKGR